MSLAPFEEARKQFERDYLVRLLKITGGNVTQAATLAKRNRTEFYKLLHRVIASSPRCSRRGRLTFAKPGERCPKGRCDRQAPFTFFADVALGTAPVSVWRQLIHR